MDPDPDPTLDTTPFFSDFKDEKKNSDNLPAGTLFCAKILFCKHYFRKGKDPDPTGPKTCGSGSPTLHGKSIPVFFRKFIRSA